MDISAYSKIILILSMYYYSDVDNPYVYIGEKNMTQFIYILLNLYVF
jgi:hypothetical protein